MTPDPCVIKAARLVDPAQGLDGRYGRYLLAGVDADEVET